MNSTTAHIEQDSHNAAVAKAGFDLADHELPEPIDSWSLSDFEDIVPGGLS
jgi:hypothetical protein